MRRHDASVWVFSALVALALGACKSPIHVSADASAHPDAADASLSSDAPDGNQPGYLSIPDKVNLGTVDVGHSIDFVLTVSNLAAVSTGQLTVAITPASPAFAVTATTCATGLAPFATCTVTVTFQPVAVGGTSATLSVTDAASPTTPATARLAGNGAPHPSFGTWISGSTDFGSVTLGSSGNPVVFTINNTTDQPATDVAVATTDPQFAISSNTCAGTTLAPFTGTCTFAITFTPSGTLGVIKAEVYASYAGVASSLPIQGTAIAPPTLTITPTPLAFDGTVLNQQSGDKFLTVTNSGGASTGVLTLPTDLGAGFVISDNTCTAALQPTETCSIAIQFTPTMVAQVTFAFAVSSASGAVATAFLTGTGRIPPPLALDPREVKNCGEPTSPDGGAALAECFADTAVGQTDGSSPNQPSHAPVPFTVTYAAPSTSSMETGQVTVSIGGANASDFVIAVGDCGPSLQPTQSCTFTVSFKPTASGLRKATITVTSTNGGNAVTNIEAIALPVDGGA